MLNFAVVGVGSIAQNFHIPAITNNQECNLIALCDINEELLDKIASEFNVEYKYSCYEELLANKSIDAVIITTPTYLHHRHTVKALKSGKHVAVEKPMAVTYSKAVDMINESVNNNKKLVCLHHNRFRPQTQVIKEAIQNNEIGKVQYLKANVLHTFGVPAPDHFSYSYSKGGGPIYDLGAHLIDIVLWFLDFSEIEDISAHSWTGTSDVCKISIEDKLLSKENYHCEDFAVIKVSFKCGAVAFLEISYLSNLPENEVSCIIHGEKGAAKWPECEIYINDGKNINIKKENIDSSVYASEEQLKNFISYIKFGNNIICPITESAEVVKVIETIHKIKDKIEPKI